MCIVQGDPLTALKWTQDPKDTLTMALRAMALAQLTEYSPAIGLLETAAARFKAEGAHHDAARTHATIAELALLSRQWARAEAALKTAEPGLRTFDDDRNLGWLFLTRARVALWRGEQAAFDEALRDAEAVAKRIDSPFLKATVTIVRATDLMRNWAFEKARRELEAARQFSGSLGYARLTEEIERRLSVFDIPVATAITGGKATELTAVQLQQRLRACQTEGQPSMIVDGWRRQLIVHDSDPIDFKKRPVLFALLKTIARSWPEPTSAETLIQRAFDTAMPNESHFARLRVEIGRLRKPLRAFGTIESTGGGWRWTMAPGRTLFTIEPHMAYSRQAIVVLLSDGAAWTVPALASVLRCSVRKVQRELAELIEAHLVLAEGTARARTYRLEGPLQGIASRMLLLSLNLER